MFKRRDIPPVLLLLLLIILVMLTLSQILVVHSGRYGKSVQSMRRLQLELRDMDVNLHSIMLQDVPSIELSRRRLQTDVNTRRVAAILAEAARPDTSWEGEGPLGGGGVTLGGGEGPPGGRDTLGGRLLQDISEGEHIADKKSLDVSDAMKAGGVKEMPNAIKPKQHDIKQASRNHVIGARQRDVITAKQHDVTSPRAEAASRKSKKRNGQRSRLRRKGLVSSVTPALINRHVNLSPAIGNNLAPVNYSIDSENVYKNNSEFNINFDVQGLHQRSQLSPAVSGLTRSGLEQNKASAWSELSDMALNSTATLSSAIAGAGVQNGSSSASIYNSAISPSAVIPVRSDIAINSNASFEDIAVNLNSRVKTRLRLAVSPAAQPDLDARGERNMEKGEVENLSVDLDAIENLSNMSDFDERRVEGGRKAFKQGFSGISDEGVKITGNGGIYSQNASQVLDASVRGVVSRTSNDVPSLSIENNVGLSVISNFSTLGARNIEAKGNRVRGAIEGDSAVGSGGGSAPLNRSTSAECLQRVCYCPPVPPGLRGPTFVEFGRRRSESEVVAESARLQPGGHWRPRDCVARHRVAVIIPYRDRREHLLVLLSHLHPMLQRQQLDYHIYVVEQSGSLTFNKARIMNAAFVEALKRDAFHCAVFHDVDLVPEDDRNMYSCPVQPRHMSVAIDEMGYKLAYQELVGGVLSMRTEHFQRVNGYSNLYWGWGAEDDDMAYRIMYVGLKITRPPESVARYKMIRHTKRKPVEWRKRAKLLYTGTRRFQFDGLNSLQYSLVSATDTPLYTHLVVDIGKPPKGF